MKQKTVKVGKVSFNNHSKASFIAGPCVFESRESLDAVAKVLKKISLDNKVGIVLKCSFDKANRTSGNSYRGKSMEEALAALKETGEKYGMPTTTDVHESAQVPLVASYVDLLQIPAFLSRQTDLIIACAKTGKPVNVKKGQFLSPWDVENIIEKIKSTGNKKIILTERGTTFGYNNLVVDMRSLEIMKSFGYPVIYDATHSVQLPGGSGDKSGGDRQFIPALARAAASIGVSGIFFETHPNPPKALSDSATQLFLKDAFKFVKEVLAFDTLAKKIR